MNLVPVAFAQFTGLSSAISLGSATAAITAASNATPIVITSTAHGLSDGDVVIIKDVGGNTAANGVFAIDNKTDDTFELVGSVGNDDYTSGGNWYLLPPKCEYVLLQAEAQNIRWRDDGTDPTASVGHIMYATGEPFLYTGKIQSFRAIEVTSGGILNLTFYANAK